MNSRLLLQVNLLTEQPEMRVEFNVKMYTQFVDTQHFRATVMPLTFRVYVFGFRTCCSICDNLKKAKVIFLCFA
jgi:hypothetical protein